MRSDHLSKHIRTHNNQRSSARSDLNGIFLLMFISFTIFYLASNKNKNIVVSSISGAPMVITATTSVVTNLTNSVILQ